MRKIRTQWSVHCDEWYQHASAMHEAVQIRIRNMTDTQPSGMHKIRDRYTAIRHAQDSWPRHSHQACTRFVTETQPSGMHKIRDRDVTRGPLQSMLGMLQVDGLACPLRGLVSERVTHSNLCVCVVTLTRATYTYACACLWAVWECTHASAVSLCIHGRLTNCAWYASGRWFGMSAAPTSV